MSTEPRRDPAPESTDRTEPLGEAFGGTSSATSTEPSDPNHGQPEPPGGSTEGNNQNAEPLPAYLDQIGAGGLSAVGVLGKWMRTTFTSLSVRNFRLFYIGQGISLVGTWVRRTAMGWLVYQITGSYALLGVIMGLALLPMIGSPIAGSIADRVDKRRMIIITQVGAALTSAAIAALVFLNWINVGYLIVLALLGGVAFAFEMPARQAFIVEMVGRDKLMNAIALNSGLVNLSRIFGPALAGFVMYKIGMGYCFAIDALSYVVVIVTLYMLVMPAFRKPEHLTSHLHALIEGAREVGKNRRVRTVLVLLFMVGVFGWSLQTLLPAIAPDLLKLTAAQYGVLMSMFGIGAIVGALFVASRKATSNRRIQVFGGVWTMTMGIYLVALFGTLLGSRRSAFWSVSGALMLTGFGAVLFMSTANTLIQTSVEDKIRGRIMGIWAVGFGGSVPLGAFLAGFVAQLISPYLTLALFATVLVIGSVAVYVSLPPRRPPVAEGEAAGTTT